MSDFQPVILNEWSPTSDPNKRSYKSRTISDSADLLTESVDLLTESVDSLALGREQSRWTSKFHRVFQMFRTSLETIYSFYLEGLFSSV